jgi:hypothetical protein
MGGREGGVPALISASSPSASSVDSCFIPVDERCVSFVTHFIGVVTT